MDSLPEPNLRLEKEVEQSKKTVVDLKRQVEEVKRALAEAKTQLQERAENQKVVNAAKATAAELAVRAWGVGREVAVLCICAVFECGRETSTFCGSIRGIPAMSWLAKSQCIAGVETDQTGLG